MIFEEVPAMKPAKSDEPTKRRICWPAPDLTCIEGGCMYCDSDGRWIALSSILRYATKYQHGLRNRGNGTTGDALVSYYRGLRNLWYGRVRYK